MLRKIILSLTVFPVLCFAQGTVNIWEGKSAEKVELLTFLLSGNDNPAVIICPGGSYFWHDMTNEGVSVAKWLNGLGFSAFVLKYRTAGTPAFITHYRYLFRGNRYPDPQEDLAQTIRLLRNRADAFGISKHNLGVFGFSAGGHLALSMMNHLKHSGEGPDFMVAVYPVVSMVEPCTHKRSRRALLGDDDKNDRALRNLLSIEKHINSNAPPVFIVNCKDDPIVDCHNSELLDSALNACGIKHKYIQYETGGHGFGASNVKGSKECRQWKYEFFEWYKSLKIKK